MGCSFLFNQEVSPADQSFTLIASTSKTGIFFTKKCTFLTCSYNVHMNKKLTVKVFVRGFFCLVSHTLRLKKIVSQNDSQISNHFKIISQMSTEPPFLRLVSGFWLITPWNCWYWWKKSVSWVLLISYKTGVTAALSLIKNFTKPNHSLLHSVTTNNNDCVSIFYCDTNNENKVYREDI